MGREGGDRPLPLPRELDREPGDAAAVPFPASSSNKLFVASQNRGAGINSGGLLPSIDVSFSTAFGFTNFTTAAGGLSFGGRTVSGFVHFGSPHGQLE